MLFRYRFRELSALGRRSLFALVLLFVLAGSLAFARSPGRFVVYAGQLPPINYRADNESPVMGIAVDVLAYLFRRAGVEFYPADIEQVPWARALELVQHQTGTVLVTVGRTAAREDLFSWVGPVSSIRLGLVAMRDRKIKIE